MGSIHDRQIIKRIHPNITIPNSSHCRQITIGRIDRDRRRGVINDGKRRCICIVTVRIQLQTNQP